VRVLLVEDDRRLVGLVRRGAEQAGMVADVVEDGEEALHAATQTPFDVIVLDVMLPGGRDGFEVCSELRARRVKTPVIMLTALDSVDERIRGLEAGADDYLAKPFALRELIARIRALARRHLADRTAILEAGRVRLDTGGRELTVDGAPLEMTAKELAVLEYLMHHPGRVLTRTQIEEHVWNYDFAGESNLVEVYVARIRRKLADAGVEGLISTIRGSGYRLQRESSWLPSSGEPASA
jgi:DNA-binding response OmpR family regulator